jgi:hypothetical protein
MVNRRAPRSALAESELFVAPFSVDYSRKYIGFGDLVDVPF